MYQNKQEKGEKNRSGCNLFVKQEIYYQIHFSFSRVLYGNWREQKTTPEKQQVAQMTDEVV